MPVPAQKGNALRDLRLCSATAWRIAMLLLALAAAAGAPQTGHAQQQYAMPQQRLETAPPWWTHAVI